MNEKAVLLSIQPRWCGLIASGKKTIEVRKTRPKIETPFKVYIYCTNDKKNHFWTGKRYSYADERSHNAFDKDGNGKVIGEFICDAIISHCEMANADIAEQRGCIRREQLFEYANGAELYGWHISDLKIYNNPKELSHFVRICPEWGKEALTDKCYACEHCYRNNEAYATECDCEGEIHIKQAPQSWCYVEVSESE